MVLSPVNCTATSCLFNLTLNYPKDFPSRCVPTLCYAQVWGVLDFPWQLSLHAGIHCSPAPTASCVLEFPTAPNPCISHITGSIAAA